MKTRTPLFAALALLAGLSAAFAPAAQAETLACPDLSTAVQVGNCPTEDELLFTYNGFCSDNARIYRKDASVCTDFLLYRKMKNVVLWESADGAFQTYLSCDLPTADVTKAKARGIAVARDGSMTRLVCAYGDGITFTHRTKATCRTQGDGDCGADPAACKASCD